MYKQVSEVKQIYAMLKEKMKTRSERVSARLNTRLASFYLFDPLNCSMNIERGNRMQTSNKLTRALNSYYEIWNTTGTTELDDNHETQQEKVVSGPNELW